MLYEVVFEEEWQDVNGKTIRVKHLVRMGPCQFKTAESMARMYERRGSTGRIEEGKVPVVYCNIVGKILLNEISDNKNPMTILELDCNNPSFSS